MLKNQTPLFGWEDAFQTISVWIFVAFQRWKSEQNAFLYHFVYPNSVDIQEMFLVSVLFIVSVCYLYTTGFEINNLAIIVLGTNHFQPITTERI